MMKTLSLADTLLIILFPALVLGGLFLALRLLLAGGTPALRGKGR